MRFGEKDSRRGLSQRYRGHASTEEEWRYVRQKSALFRISVLSLTKMCVNLFARMEFFFVFLFGRSTIDVAGEASQLMVRSRAIESAFQSLNESDYDRLRSVA